MGKQAASADERVERPAPPLTARTEQYWRSGADGKLRIARCQSCEYYLHPPLPVCSQCHGRTISFEAVSGKGTIWSYTINRYQWSKGLKPPYIVAEVELLEQEGLKIVTNVVGLNVEDAEIDMQVHVEFEQAGDAYIPVFRP